MRCGRCRKEISGIGKPAIPPVVPAAVAFAGSIWGLFNLTLGQDPANALPNWSPVTGWGVGLGSLGVASVLAWIGLARRKCPECGATQMLDAMEEEAQIATERMAAVNAAVAAARVEWGNPQTPPDRTRELRAEIEAEVRAAQARENADKLATLERDLRSQFEVKLRAELERQQHAKPIVVAPSAAPPVSATDPADVVTPPPVVLAKPAAAPAAAVARPVTPGPVAPAKIFTASPAPATRPVTPPPVSAAKTLVASPAPATRPVTPPPVSAAKTLVASPAPATRSVTPGPVSAAKVFTTSPPPASKPVTPAPASITAAIAAATAAHIAPASESAVAPSGGPSSGPPVAARPPASVPSTEPKTSLPAAPHPTVDTAPLALLVQTISPAARVAVPVGAESAAPATQATAADTHERAKRRARVILSDLLAYHREDLVKAARAGDPRKELGTLWRDAIISYNEAAPPEIRGVTNYLEDELSRQLAELRRS